MNAPAADPRELPMRIVGNRVKTVWDRYAEIVRHSRYFRRTRAARIEIVQPDGTTRP